MSSSQVRVTANDRGPIINLANWITLVVMCLSSFVKVGTKYRKIGTLQKDDFYMLAAMVRSSMISRKYNIVLPPRKKLC